MASATRVQAAQGEAVERTLVCGLCKSQVPETAKYRRLLAWWAGGCGAPK